MPSRMVGFRLQNFLYCSSPRASRRSSDSSFSRAALRNVHGRSIALGTSNSTSRSLTTALLPWASFFWASTFLAPPLALVAIPVPLQDKYRHYLIWVSLSCLKRQLDCCGRHRSGEGTEPSSADFISTVPRLPPTPSAWPVTPRCCASVRASLSALRSESIIRGRISLVLVPAASVAGPVGSDSLGVSVKSPHSTIRTCSRRAGVLARSRIRVPLACSTK